MRDALMAHVLVGALVSLRVLARGQPDRRVLEDVVKTAVAVFDSFFGCMFE